MQQHYLSLEGYTVSNPGQRPGIVEGKEILAWKAVRQRRWRRSCRAEGAHFPNDEADGMHLYREKGESFLQSASKIFHTQRPFSVLTLLALGDEMYYICIEIWEEPRLPPFFVTFPLKSGI